jgi:hypothetical protein
MTARLSSSLGVVPRATWDVQSERFSDWKPRATCGTLGIMTTTDLEKARAAHSALKAFFAAHPKGRLERRALDDVYALCAEAERAVSSDECRIAVRKIASYSVILCSAEPPRGADFVRLRVQNALESFRSNLRAIESGER